MDRFPCSDGNIEENMEIVDFDRNLRPGCRVLYVICESDCDCDDNGRRQFYVADLIGLMAALHLTLVCTCR